MAVLPAQELPATFSLQGRVVDVLGAALPAAVVSVLDDADRVFARVNADGEGLYQLPRLPMGDNLRVVAGAAGKAQAAFGVPDGGAVRPLSLVLEDGREVQVHVRDAEGNPVAGATVFVHAAANGLPQALPAEVEGVTDNAGIVRLRGVPWRAARWFVFAAGRRPIEIEAPEVTATALECGVGPEDSRTCRFEVVGLPPEAEGRTRFLVSAHDGRGWPLPSRWRSAALAVAAAVELPVLPFATDVQAVGSGRTVQPAAWLWPGGDVRPVTFTVDPPMPLFRQVVRLQDQDGKPLPGVAIAVRGRDGRILATAVSKTSGRVELQLPLARGARCSLGLLAGTWCWQEWSGRLAPDGIHWCDLVVGDPEVDEPVLTVAPAAKLAGTFVAADGAPLPFAAVRIRGADGWSMTATDRNGRIALGGLPPGRHSLRVEDALGRIGEAELEIEANATAACPVLQFQPSADVLGQVIDSAGKPVPSAAVRAGPRATLSAVDGRFVVRGLPPGQITCQATGLTGRGTMQMTLRAGVENAAMIVLP
ncbi:MAG: carboxypeptidase regulatory-like domain-containing protein [Planctomycetes bacterium]|nr:carboxypeptidase regulatory-like domain-containing protein [Planctomycetota bacterium]